MIGLGSRLKEARVEKGFTLDDLQSITKIQKRYLSGIENEDFSMMPGSFYVRAFIKQYAEAVGENPDEMLALFKDSNAATLPEETQKIQSPGLSRRRVSGNSNRINEIIPKVIVALFILVIIAVFYFLWLNSAANKQNKVDVEPETPIYDERVKPDGQSNEEVPPVEEEPVEEEEPEPEIVQSITFNEVNGETSTYTLENAETFLLEIQIKGDSWIGVRDAKGVERMGTARVMKAGESVEFDVSDTEFVRIRVGRTYNTDIYVNGELLTYEVPTEGKGITQNIVIQYSKEQ